MKPELEEHDGVASDGERSGHIRVFDAGAFDAGFVFTAWVSRDSGDSHSVGSGSLAAKDWCNRNDASSAPAHLTLSMDGRSANFARMWAGPELKWSEDMRERAGA